MISEKAKPENVPTLTVIGAYSGTNTAPSGQ